jgi:Icc-related predicted phosphoesterase
MGKVILFLVDDLHLEGRPTEMQNQFAQDLGTKLTACKEAGNNPILICAGDISEKDAGIEWAAQFNVETIYVCGNHEFWNNDYYELIDLLKEKVKQPEFNHVHFLHNEEVIIHGVRFLGATMWTELGHSWAWSKRNYILKHFFSMADFRKITARKFYRDSSKVDEMFKMLVKNGVDPEQATNLIASESFNPLIQMEENALSVDFIENKIIEPFDGQTVVVTHHLPIPDFWMKTQGMHEHILTAPYINNKGVYQEYSKQKIPPEKDILMMGFYVNSAYQFFEHNFSPDIWIHGHFHKSVDGFIGTTRVVSSPVGYLRQSETLNLKQIEIGNEVNNYIEDAIREISNFNWTGKINKTLYAFKRVITDFSKPITDEAIDFESFFSVLNVFQDYHEKNLKDVEIFVSNILYNYIKITNREASLSDQLYITSFISGFGKWASKNGNNKVGIDILNLTLNERSFLNETQYKKLKDKNELEHYSDWLREIEKIDKQVFKFKDSLIEFFTRIKNGEKLIDKSALNED